MRRACIAWTVGILFYAPILPAQTSAPSTEPAPSDAPTTAPSASRFLTLLSGGDPALRIARRTALEAWHQRTTVDAYNAVGDRDPKWDDMARSALRLQGECNNPILGSGKYEELLNDLNDAVNNGCNDPLILYFLAGYQKLLDVAPASEVLGIYLKAGDEMLKRPYPPVRKIYVLMHAAEIKLSRQSTLADAGKLLDAALAEAPALAADKDTPTRTLVELFSSLTTLDGRRTGDLKKSGDQLLAVLAQARPGSAPFYVLKARDLIEQSRLAPEDQRKQMLADASDAIEKGYAADPSDPIAPVQMLTLLPFVPDGQQKMDLWLERALKADPDNYTAAELYLESLFPRNGGSPRDMIDFALVCAKGGNYDGGLPLILVAAHEELAHYTPHGYSVQEFPVWYAQPQVFADFKSVYEPLLQHDPSNTYQRCRYVRFACFAAEWTIARDNLAVLGDHFSRRVFTGAEYKQLRQLVDRVLTQPPATAPAASPATAASTSPVAEPPAP